MDAVMAVDYPKEKLEIIIVNHGSTDKTADIAKQLIAHYSSYKILLVHKKRQEGEMKAHAFNAGLACAKGEFIACVDADTLVMRNCLQEMVAYFEDEKVGAVISTIKVQHPKNIYEKIQHLEYIFATFTRSLMSKIDTLHVTPGALSIYRKILFDKYGGFDENNVTEDLEMAMRLRYHHYTIKLAQNSITYTKVPDSFHSLWSQRVRWFRGFIYNSLKYRKMVFNKKYDLINISNVLHHIDDKETVLQNLRNCLKLNGKLLIVEPNYYYPLRWIIETDVLDPFNFIKKCFKLRVIYK